MRNFPSASPAGWMRRAAHPRLPRKNNTPDNELIARAMLDGRIVISKDDDFVQSFLITGEPPLLLISTGYITNAELEKILRANLSAIETAFASSKFVVRLLAMHWWCMNEVTLIGSNVIRHPERSN